MFLENIFMKKFLLILLVLINITVFAGEELSPVYLDDPIDTSIKIPTIDKSNFDETKIDKSSQENVFLGNIQKYGEYNPYNKKTFSFNKEKKWKDFYYGTNTDYTYNADSMSHMNTLYTKYKKNKFSLDAYYRSNSSLLSPTPVGRGIFAFTPEYEINQHFSIQNSYSTNLLENNQKNEMKLFYKPFEDDRMDFNVGTSQIYSTTNAPKRTQINFGTNFRF